MLESGAMRALGLGPSVRVYCRLCGTGAQYYIVRSEICCRLRMVAFAATGLAGPGILVKARSRDWRHKGTVWP